MLTLLLVATLAITPAPPLHDLHVRPEVSLWRHAARQVAILQRTIKAYASERLQRVDVQTLQRREVAQYLRWCPLE